MNETPQTKILQIVTDTLLNRGLATPSDPMLVGVSGGKDSLVLLDILYKLGFSQLHSIHVRMDPTAPLPFAGYCQTRSEFSIIETDAMAQARQSQRRNICYMCSRARRKAISEFAVQRGIGLIALAHHRDDAVETLLLNLIFQREISTMLPAQELFKGQLTIIRPLYDAPESLLARYAKAMKLPVSDWQCGYENHSRRAWIRTQIRQWQKTNPGIKVADNIFQALQNVNPGWLPAPSARCKPDQAG